MLGLLLASAAFTTVVGCKKESAGTGGSTATGGDKPITVGFIYVGTKDDYGYNQAHATGAAAVKSSGAKVLEEESIPETLAVQKSMESMINLDGASLIFPTSYGYFQPHTLEMAKKFPNVTFLHCGGTYKEGMPANVGTYFAYIDECEYVSGIVAGKMTKTNKLGFIAAKPIPQVLRNINAFTLGAQSVNPKISTTVVFTGDWFMPVKEADAATSLIDQGIDVLTCHVDSPKAILTTAEKRGIFCCGYHANGAALAPKGYLTGSEWDWGKTYQNYVDMVKSGKAVPHTLRGGLKDGMVKNSPYGAPVSDDAKKLGDQAKAAFLADKLIIFKGPLKDNKGTVVIPEGTSQVQTDPSLEGMNYLVEGVVGNVSGT
jgi:simple sugar transport system substrate-binding protein